MQIEEEEQKDENTMARKEQQTRSGNQSVQTVPFDSYTMWVFPVSHCE